MENSNLLELSTLVYMVIDFWFVEKDYLYHH